jgi:hypothetical protein
LNLFRILDFVLRIYLFMTLASLRES